MAKRVFWPVFGTATLPTGASVTSPRGKVVFWPVFGTAPLPTDASVASSRGEGVIYRVFGTATLPTDASVASSRSHCELVYRIVAILGFVKFTWHELLLIIKQLATKKVPGEHNLMPPGTGMCPTGTCNEDWRAR